MERRARRKFTSEYKAEVVRLVRDGGKTIGEVSRDLGLTESAVRQWARQARIGAVERRDAGDKTRRSSRNVPEVGRRH